MAWPVKSILALISLPVFTICAFSIYFYRSKEQAWKRYLNNLHMIEAEFKIPLSSIGDVIGRGGEAIKELQEKTDTIINFNSTKEDDSIRICKVFGTKENVELAKMLILEALDPKNIEILEMWVAENACGKLVGRCGDNIRSIIRSSNASVFVDKGNTRDSKILLKIRGKKHEIAVAKKLIEQTVEEVIKSLPPRSPRTKTKFPKRNGDVNRIPEYEEVIATTTDSMIQVYVSSVESPSHFWIQLCSPRSVELDHLVDDMTDYYSKPENQNLHKLKELRTPAYNTRSKAIGSNLLEKEDVPPSEAETISVPMGHSTHIQDESFTESEESENVSPNTHLTSVVQDIDDRIQNGDHEVKKGQIIASKFQHDGKWYRVEVFSVEVDECNPDESQVHVFYIDYGDLSVYRLGDLLELKSDFLHLKFQAIEVSTRGILPKEDNWNEEATEAFSDMVHSAQWKVLLAQVVCHKDMENSYRKVPIPFIRLYDPDGQQGVDIGSQFIEKGYALRDENDEPEVKDDDDDDDDATDKFWPV